MLKRPEVLNQNRGFGVDYNHLGFLLEMQNSGLILRGPEVGVLSRRPDSSGAGWSWTLMQTFELEKHLIILGKHIGL